MANKKSASSNGIQSSELTSLADVSAEVDASEATAHSLVETVAEVKQYMTNLPDRWAGADWETQGLSEVIGTAPEVAASMGDFEKMVTFLEDMKKEIKKASAVGEVAASVGASGDVGRFTSA